MLMTLRELHYGGLAPKNVSAATLSLTSLLPRYMQFSLAQACAISLPDVRHLAYPNEPSWAGMSLVVLRLAGSVGNLILKDFGGTTLATLVAAGPTRARLVLVDASTASGVWKVVTF